MNKIFFQNDYGEGAHPLIMQRLMETNLEHTCGYGLDDYSLRAQQLLIEHPEMSIEEVTEASGFESAAYFRRVFGRIVGKSPRDYRKSVRDQMPF